MTSLRVHSTNDHVTTLGPGPALGLWVQGCGLACRGCTSRSTWSPDGGFTARTSDVAAWMDRSPHRHLTISGGEPMEQAPALVALIDEARAQRDWVVTCYSGFTTEALRTDRRPGTAALLDRLDVLIDGPYVSARHASLLWRASTNQRIHDLTGRAAIPVDDLSAGVACEIRAGVPRELIGVFPTPGFLDELSRRLADQGAPVVVDDATRSFPFPTTTEDH